MYGGGKPMIALEFFKNDYEDDPIAFQYVHQVPAKDDIISLYLEYKKGYQYFKVLSVEWHFDCVTQVRTDTIHRASIILLPIPDPHP
jgi:hypothetical protein